MLTPPAAVACPFSGSAYAGGHAATGTASVTPQPASHLRVKVPAPAHASAPLLGNVGGAHVNAGETEDPHTSDHSSAECVTASLAGLAFNNSSISAQQQHLPAIQANAGSGWMAGTPFGTPPVASFGPFVMPAGAPQLPAAGGSKKARTPVCQSPRAGMVSPFESSEAVSEGNSKGGKRKRGAGAPAFGTAAAPVQPPLLQVPFGGSEGAYGAQFSSNPSFPGLSGGWIRLWVRGPGMTCDPWVRPEGSRG